VLFGNEATAAFIISVLIHGKEVVMGTHPTELS
jgi:hypothetical protein